MAPQYTAQRYMAHPPSEQVNRKRQGVCAQLVGFANTDPELWEQAQKHAEAVYKRGRVRGWGVPWHDLHSLYYYENMLEFIQHSA